MVLVSLLAVVGCVALLTHTTQTVIWVLVSFRSGWDADGVLTVLVDEILLSSDKTIAIIDGSGVLHDPAGLNREELVRLAKLRKPVGFFDTSKLGKGGYLIRVEDQDVKLPCKFSFVLRECSADVACSWRARA